MTDELFLRVDDLKDFAQIIQPEGNGKNDIIVRKGIPQDILPDSGKGIEDARNKIDDVAEVVDSIAYTQAEFEKEFQAESYSHEDQFEEDDSRQTIVNYSITEREEQTLEEMADTVSSSEVFNSASGKSGKMYVVRAKLCAEDPKTIDFDVQETKLILLSHKYKMRVYFTKPVYVNTVKSTFIKDGDILEIVIKHK